MSEYILYVPFKDDVIDNDDFTLINVNDGTHYYADKFFKADVGNLKQHMENEEPIYIGIVRYYE